MYKVVEGLVPALPTDIFVKLARTKRNIKAKHFEDCISSNIVPLTLAYKYIVRVPILTRTRNDAPRCIRVLFMNRKTYDLRV
jgi:hypothetical protein